MRSGRPDRHAFVSVRPRVARNPWGETGVPPGGRAVNTVPWTPAPTSPGCGPRGRTQEGAWAA